MREVLRPPAAAMTRAQPGIWESGAPQATTLIAAIPFSAAALLYHCHLRYIYITSICYILQVAHAWADDLAPGRPRSPRLCGIRISRQRPKPGSRPIYICRVHKDHDAHCSWLPHCTVHAMTGLKDQIPPWLSSAVRKPRTWKNYARCMLATLAAMVVMLVQSCKSRQ
jgi:hypothetical protein